MRGRAFYLLLGSTGVFLIASGLFWFSPLLKGGRSGYEVDQESAERNERSTPRSFILPATPSVAEEQEHQAREVGEGLDIFRCLRQLQALGYGSDDTPPALTARNVGAIFRFQKDHGVTTTGRLDRVTVRLLECQ